MSRPFLAILLSTGFCLGTTAATTLAAESYNLSDPREAAPLVRVRTQLDVHGDLLTKADNKEQKHRLQVSATLEYDERRLGISGESRLSLRHYQQCNATIRIDQGEHKPTLHASRRGLAVKVTADRATIFCPASPLTREELDLVDIPGNSAVLPLLLPGKPLEIGGTWTVAADTLAMLLGIDTVSASDVRFVLFEAAEGGTAKVQFAGHVDGAAQGVATEIRLKGSLDFDLTARRIGRFEMTVNEDRRIGHIGPGLNVECRLVVTATPVKSAPQIED